MKVVANACLGFLMVGVGEALTLADALGLPQQQVLDVLAESPVGATIKSKRSNIESGEWPANFKLSLAAKDLGLVTDVAERAGLTLTLAPVVREQLEAAVAAGRGESDYSVVIDEIRSTRGA
jgi:3-hydroxyisobutyrate dehydrogenase